MRLATRVDGARILGMGLAGLSVRTMTHLNLDTQPEAIRQFVLELVGQDGVVLESAGRPVACVVPPPGADVSSTSSDQPTWSDEKNQRRCELIDRKYDHGLTSEEAAELAILQDEMQRHIDRVAPLPLGEARRLHQELLQKAMASQSDSDK